MSRYVELWLLLARNDTASQRNHRLCEESFRTSPSRFYIPPHCLVNFHQSVCFTAQRSLSDDDDDDAELNFIESIHRRRIVINA